MCLVFLFVSFFVSPHSAVCLGLTQQTFGFGLLLSVIDYEYGVCYRCVALVTAFYFVSLCRCVVVFVLVLVLFSVSPHSALRQVNVCILCVCSSCSLYRRIRHCVLVLHVVVFVFVLLVLCIAAFGIVCCG
jgi:hypothetical protein